MFHYKRSRVTIPGYPKIQVDDQIRIYERVTSETYYHYVTGITSNYDADTREWTYTLDTHWLGTNPSTDWKPRFTELRGVTQTYLNMNTEDD
jgi:hypothetical protein